MTKGSPRSPKPAPQEPDDRRHERLGVSPAPLHGAPTPDDEALALESARYIAQMSTELASMARASRLELLAYFLEMARMEAISSVRKLEGTPE
jgi:hypothetical protein